MRMRDTDVLPRAQGPLACVPASACWGLFLRGVAGFAARLAKWRGARTGASEGLPKRPTGGLGPRLVQGALERGAVQSQACVVQDDLEKAHAKYGVVDNLMR